MKTRLHTNILPAVQQRLFERLAAQPWLAAFYLAGGTALALHFGHRQSIDFDFFLMKRSAISGRGSRKDFIELHFLLEHFPLRSLLRAYPRKFGGAVKNEYHLLKSLVYFTDAERDPMPRMLQSVAWSAVKARIIAVKAIDLGSNKFVRGERIY